MAEKEIINEAKDTAKKEVKKEVSKPKKPSIFSRIGAWFKSCKSEMKKVVWASWSSVSGASSPLARFWTSPSAVVTIPASIP